MNTIKYQWLMPIVRVADNLQPGEAYQATKGIEFTCEAQSFVGVLYRIAKEMGWKATVVVGLDKLNRDTVVYSFYRESDLMRPNLAAYPLVKKMKGR